MTTPTIVLGAGGYVGAEFLRLIAQHSQLTLVAAVSDQFAGQAITSVFHHLRDPSLQQAFMARDAVNELVTSHPTLAVFCAAPHGAAAGLLDSLIQTATESGTQLHIVDASADFRFADSEAYAAVYGQPHGAPQRLAAFKSAVPELAEIAADHHIAHPGCFATAMQLAMAPLLASNLAEPRFFANGITGATGAGKTPIATTHTPERHSNLFAYKPLAHRHAPEVVAHLEAATDVRPKLHFTPHSGPFSRGIHMTVNGVARKPVDLTDLQDAVAQYYADADFVRVVDGMPKLKSVVGSNYADIGLATDGEAITACVVIDNLLKGAAGGSMQWMNRLLGFTETDSLEQSAVGWT
ncbi:MAG: N-acetyl-gamma-glutamyl-phosphate reductase [Pseudomonadota bacterium]